MKLMALEDVAGGDTIREAPELGQRGSQPLLVGTPPKTLLVYVRRREEADCLGRNFSVSRPHELVQAINEDIFGREHERRLTCRKPDLHDFLGRCRKTRRGFDEEVMLGIDPVPPFTLQPKLRETLVDSRSVWEIQIDIGSGVRAASPKLDRDASNHDRAKTQRANDVVDESCDGELALGLVFEPK